MTDWWNNLVLRERRIIGVSGGLAILLIIYFYAWDPLARKVTTVRTSVQQNTELVGWMQPAIIKINSLKQAGARLQIKATPTTLLTVINESLQKTKLASFAGKLDEASAGKVEIEFAAVPFDYFINWLETLWKDSGVRIDQMSLTPPPTKAIGVVKVDITLSV